MSETAETTAAAPTTERQQEMSRILARLLVNDHRRRQGIDVPRVVNRQELPKAERQALRTAADAKR
ncbi:MAG: hypothetical protein Q8O42_15425 [Acidobacteriota bacterium]|nr:hypothetical protein [Acidobacteriota bacterium]